MAGLRQAAAIAIFSLLVGAAAVRAEIIPLPTPAPAPKDRSTPPKQSPAPAAPAAPTSSSSPLDFLNSLVTGKHPSTDVSQFDDKQRALVTRINKYLSSVQVLTGNFVQIGPDGRRTKGHLFLQKPGKVRFEYDPPNPIDIIADGSHVVIHDPAGSDQSYSLSQTPLRFL